MGFANRDQSNERTNSGGQGGFDNSWKHELRIAPGETVIGMFSSFNGEPFNYDRHSSASRQTRSSVCGRSPHGPGRCKACDAAESAYARSRKQTLIKGGSPRQAYSFISFRPIFKDVPQVGDDGQVRTGPFPRACNDRNQPLRITRTGETTRVEPYPGDRHEYDGVYNWELEGLKVLNVSGSKRRNEGAEILKLDAELESQCVCGAQVGELVKRTANVIVEGHACASCGKRYAYDMNSSAVLRCTCGVQAKPIEILRCEAGCAQPQRDSILGRLIMITKTGEGLDSQISFRALPRTDLPPQYSALLVDESGKPRQANFQEIYPYNPELEAKMLRSIAPQLGSIGVMVEQILSGQSQMGGAPQGPPGFGGLGGGHLPNLGGGNAPLPPNPGFPAGLPIMGGAPAVGTVSTVQPSGAPPLATGGPQPASGPPPAMRLSLRP